MCYVKALKCHLERGGFLHPNGPRQHGSGEPPLILDRYQILLGLGDLDLGAQHISFGDFADTQTRLRLLQLVFGKLQSLLRHGDLRLHAQHIVVRPGDAEEDFSHGEIVLVRALLHGVFAQLPRGKEGRLQKRLCECENPLPAL